MTDVYLKLMFGKNVSKRFVSEVTILNHSTTIKEHYTPVIHCGPVRQAAEIISIDKHTVVKTEDTEQSYLRTNDKALVTFEFKFHPEYLEIGQTFFFRDGATKGVGRIVSIGTDEANIEI